MKTQKIVSHKEDSENSSNVSNKNDVKDNKKKVKLKVKKKAKDNIELDLVEERCFRCGKRMLNVKYIYYDIDSGNYVCKSCNNKYKLDAILCDDLDF